MTSSITISCFVTAILSSDFISPLQLNSFSGCFCFCSLLPILFCCRFQFDCLCCGHNRHIASFTVAEFDWYCRLMLVIFFSSYYPSFVHYFLLFVMFCVVSCSFFLYCFLPFLSLVNSFFPSMFILVFLLYLVTIWRNVRRNFPIYILVLLYGICGL